MLDDADIDRCVASAGDLALFFVGATQERMQHELVAVRERMELQLAPAFGPELAAFVADAFVATVAKCKIEIEKAAVGNSLGGTQ
jgi:hypothetical protein